MTTKKSSANPFVFTFRRGLLSGSVAPAVINCIMLLILAVVIPASALFSNINQYDSEYNVIGQIAAKSQYTYLFLTASDILIPMIIVIGAGLAVVSAIFSFNFITSKKTVNVFYSLGIDRPHLFMGKYLSGITLLIVSVIIPMVTSLIINLVACGSSAELWKAFFFITLSILAVVIVAFSITSAIFASVGTTFETSVFTAILLFFPNIFFYGLQTLMDRFLYGSPYGASFLYANMMDPDKVTGLSQRFGGLSPLFFNETGLVDFAAMSADKKYNPDTVLSGMKSISGSPDFLWSVLWIVLGFAIGLLGMYLFKRRKAEICGFIGTNKVLNTVATFIFGFFMLCVFVNKLPLSLAANVAIGALVFAIVYVVLELLLLRDTKKFVRGLYRLPIELAVAGVFVVLFWTGLFGFSNKIPDKADIKNAAVSYTGVNDEFAYYSAEGSWSNIGQPSFVGGGSLVDGFKSDADLDAVLAMHKEVIDTAGAKDSSGKTVQFVYTLKDGTVLRRSFKDVSSEAYEKVLSLEKTDLYNERLDTVFHGEMIKPETDESNDRIGDANVLYDTQTALRSDTSVVTLYSAYLNKGGDLTLTKAQRAMLLDALYNDLIKRPVSSKYFSEKTPLAYLNFRNEESGKAENGDIVVEYNNSGVVVNNSAISINGLSECSPLFSNGLWNISPTVSVTEDMTETINVLKKIGAYDKILGVPEYSSAEIVSVKDYSANNEWQFIEEKGNFFTGSFVIRPDSTESEGYVYGDIASLGGTTITDKAMVTGLAENAKATGMIGHEDYFLVLYTGEEETGTVLYIDKENVPSSVMALLK